MKKVYFLIVLALILVLLFTGCAYIAKITVSTDEDLYRSVCYGPETATGFGTRIKPKGTWFMYNHYPGGEECGANYCNYYIQAGNPKNGTTFIGSYWIADNGDGTFTAGYVINPNFVVVDEHLAISDTMNFTASPGTDDNADWFVPFADSDGQFYIFAHLEVDCAGQ